MTNIELKEKVVDIAKNYKTIYGMGTWGWIVTKSAIERKKKESSWWTNTRINTISKVIGKNYFMFDCVGLIKGILWGWKGTNAIYGGAGYAVNGVPDVNTEGMLSKCKSVSTNFNKIEVGEYLWMNGHCGVYIGDGLAVECTPKWDNKVQITAVGNIGKKSGYNTRTWTKHGKLPYITYVKEEEEKVEQYTIIVDKIPVYTNSTNAKNNKNSVGTWSKGTYYVFNKYASMINITKTIGVAGAWINPADNVIKEETPKEEEVVEKPIEEEKPIETPSTENTENKPDTSEEAQPSTDNPIEEETTQETPSNEEIEDNTLVEEPKVNIFAQIIKIVIDFIIKLFRK